MLEVQALTKLHVRACCGGGVGEGLGGLSESSLVFCETVCIC